MKHLSLEQAIAGFLDELLPGTSLVLGYSGGRDSSVLLHLLARLCAERPALRFMAAHVHHGLSPNADAWALHCRDECARLGVPLTVSRVRVDPDNGLEAGARAARYRALAELIPVDGVLVTAHHQDDQAETVLLRLLRGSGTRGLGAMEAKVPFQRGMLARPLLGVPAVRIQAWASEHGIRHIEDESNASLELARNFLRHRIMPELHRRFPGASACLARSAMLLSESDELLNEVAMSDLAMARTRVPAILRYPVLLSLSPARARHAIRFWLDSLGWPMPSRVQLERLFAEVLTARQDARPELRLPPGTLHRYRDYLVATPPETKAGTGAEQDWNMRDVLPLSTGIGFLRARPASGGLRAPRPGEPVRIAFRAGGERFHPDGRVHSQRLKKLWQEAGIWPWMRERLPLVYYGEKLVAVPGVGVAIDALATGNDAALTLELVDSNGEPVLVSAKGLTDSTR